MCGSNLIPRKVAASAAAGRGSKWPKAAGRSVHGQEGVKYEVPQRGFLACAARQALDHSQACIGVGLNCGERWWRAGGLVWNTPPIW